MKIAPNPCFVPSCRAALSSPVAVFFLCVPLFLLLTPPARAQAAGVNQAGPAYLHGQVDSSAVPQAGKNGDAARVEAMRDAERRRRVLADTARLVQLSNELKEEVDRTAKDQLSLTVMRKAAEMEKLAHDLKENVRY